MTATLEDSIHGSTDSRKSVEKSRSPETAKDPEVAVKRKWGKLGIVSALAYANFWMAASVSLQAPFFPREAELKGATPSQYGLVFGVFELVVIIMSPVYGKLIPTVSPRFIICAGVLVGGTSCCLFGVLDLVPAGRQYLAMAFLVRIFEGFGAAALFTSSFTIVASEFPDSVATSFSLMETAFGLGLIVGPTIGGALYQLGGFLLPFAVNGAFLLLGCVLLGFLLPPIGEAEKRGESRDLLAFLLDGGIASFTLAIVTTLLFIGFNAATLEPHLRQFDLSPVLLGLIFVITGGIYALTTPIWGWVCDKGADPLYVAVLGYSLSCIGLLFIGPAPFVPFQPTLWTVIGSLVVLGFGLSAKLVASFIGALKNVRQRGFPDNLATYGMVSALFSTACSTGAFIGPSVGGFLLDTTGYSMGTVVIFALEVFFMATLISYVLFRQRKAKNEEAESENEALLQQSLVKRYSYSAL